MLEIIKPTHPVKLRVWYYCTIARKNSVYGNGKFTRMNSTNEDDTGIEEESCIMTTFKKLNAGGKLPAAVKRIISDSTLIDWDFNRQSKRKQKDIESSSEESEDNSTENSEEEKESVDY